MSTYVIGFHDGWMHHPVASVESGFPPILADSDADWCVEMTAGDVEYMNEEELTALEYIIDLAHDGQLSHATGKHEPYMDGEPRREDDIDIMRMYEQRREFCNRHGGGWGCDPTCADCTDDDGKPRPRGIGS